MEENKPLPEFGTTQELVDYFDTHDMGDHWELMPEAHFEVSLEEKTYLVSVDDELRRSRAARYRTSHAGAFGGERT